MHAVAHCGSSHPAVSPLPVTVITEEKIKEVGGRLKKFKDEWPTISRQMGGELCTSRLQDRVHFTSTHKTKGTGHQTTCQRISKERSSYRSRLSPREGSHLQDRTPLPEGLSVKFRPGSQEDGGLATHSESKTTESVHKTKEIQNGVIVGGPQSTHKGSRGHVNRPKGPSPAYPYSQGSPEMVTFSDPGPGVCL